MTWSQQQHDSESEMRSILKLGIDPDFVTDKGNSLLHLMESAPIGLLLLDHDIQHINSRNRDGVTPLMTFSSSSEPSLLQEALNRGVKLEDEDHEGYNALHYAVISDREVQLGLQWDKEFTQVMNAAVLISAGADVLRGDSCQCSCSLGGCAPSSKFLSSEAPCWNNI